ncbi:Rmi1p NDAI_0E03220 [Naumovozyma dairenensis CBS 421]|uniref:RecQ mediated genome instability protein 1 OB-fold domain-containing protein n=1 Tax=Naumovozyma dairenensis (strain ATCC 10597 / BCRC 20456 / CBS 421 / NBRC 0211 / NRRL Y-12639) TaxID=1071378 RepID=G0WBL9_NAUDC|nr:hypothetical protein NDAI_0E03220 [Naumovozyma dairenensis CBS 421]CCD25139.1 hypothetical protein NDAI_0E03220 [Naumovozyma dairenensis CBS 421]
MSLPTSIISQDITGTFDLPTNISSLGSREQLIIRAYQNEPWFPNESTTAILEKKLCKVNRELLFQILMVENISKSKLAQVDDIKVKLDPKNQKVDRLRSGQLKAPPTYKVVTQVDVDADDNIDRTGIDNIASTNNYNNNNNNNNNSNNSTTKAVFKLTLQSKNGDIFFAINSTPLPWISCMLGSKIVIKPGTIFNKGVFIISDTKVVFLGGINRVWNENRDHKMSAYLEAKLDREKETSKGNKQQNKRKRKAPGS